MKDLRKLLYGIVYSFIIVWILGCSNKVLKYTGPSNINSLENGSSLNSLCMVQSGISDHSSNFHGLVNTVNECKFINKNRYNYNCVNRGSYSFDCYTVKPGDTLFYIAWITGNQCSVLAKKNNINVNSILKVGQVLQVNSNDRNYGSKCLNNKFSKKKLKNIIMTDFNSFSRVNFCQLDGVAPKNMKNEHSLLERRSYNVSSSSGDSYRVIRNVSGKVNLFSEKSKEASNAFNKNKSTVSWYWPVHGKIISTFSFSEGGNKGIDISGIVGQPVFSAAPGKVVYAGDALFGYGNLIIIKHNYDFLSTYAHNDKILVVEQQNVIAGQKIATMGNSGTDVTKLHFEIRYKGKSVDPLHYLPKR